MDCLEYWNKFKFRQFISFLTECFAIFCFKEEEKIVFQLILLVITGTVRRLFTNPLF